MEFQNSHFTYLDTIRDSETALYEALWHACAGPSVTVPRAGERVFYFPQGHLEQVEAFTDQVMDLPRCDLPSKILCRVINVQLQADPETDEVFAQIALLPEKTQDENAAEMESPLPPLPEFLVHSFCKTLTPSDTSTHGAFSVPKRYADQCLPQLDMSIQPPSQELVARDLQGNQWFFNHIYRGQPRRHLLTRGWAEFVSSKRLVTGDVFVFLRAENGDLCVGVRRAMKPQDNIPSSLISVLSKYLGVLATAREALASRTIFTISYKPRTSPAEFIIPFDQYMKAVNNSYSVGMRLQMKVNEEGYPEQISGTIVGIEDADPVKWPGSFWRCLKVRWDETCIITRPQRVSPWKIELALAYPTPKPLPMFWHESNVMPLSTDSPVTGEGAGFSRVLQGENFSTFGGNFARINESAIDENSVMQAPFTHDKKIDMFSASRSNNEPINTQFLLNSGPTANASNWNWCCCPLIVDQTLETANPMGKQVLDQEEKRSLLGSPRSLTPPGLPDQLANAFGRIFI